VGNYSKKLVEYIEEGIGDELGALICDSVEAGVCHGKDCLGCSGLDAIVKLEEVIKEESLHQIKELVKEWAKGSIE